MRLPYILGHNDSLLCHNGVQAQDSFCEHTSNRKITTLVHSLCFLFFVLFLFVFWSILLSFLFSFFYSWLSAGCCHQQMIATFTPEGHLIPRQERKNLQAVNELPSMPSVKGVYKLTEAFVRALFAPSLFLAIATTFCLFLSPLPPPPHLTLPPALQFSPSTCLLHAPVAPWRERRCLALALSSTHCQRGSCLELAI